MIGRIRANGRSLWTGLALAIVVTTATAQEPGPAPGKLPDPARLRQHVETLASPEFAGRSGPGGEKAAAYVADHLRKLGLAPLFGDSYEQVIPDLATPGNPPLGRNVGAKLAGADPALADEWIILAAHFDHLGVRGGRLYPGADDNASGVAMLLEVARNLAASEGPDRPRRSVMLIGFDLEERGLWGSRYFVEHMPVPLDKVKLFVTADMLGRALAGVCAEHLFVMGTERFAPARGWLAEAAKSDPVAGHVRLAVVGADLLGIDRSDYGPFRARSVPFLFFSTGENPAYHTPDDTAATLDYPKLESATRLIQSAVAHAAAADSLPPWPAAPDHPLEEAAAIRDVLQRLLDHRADLKIPPFQANLMASAIRTLDDALARGDLTPAERSRVVRTAQVVLFTVL